MRGLEMLMRKNWKDRKGVSPVIATILMVAITVVLAAVLYVMVMGFGGDEAKTPTVSIGFRSVASFEYEVYVISLTGGSIALDKVEAVVVSGPAVADTTYDNSTDPDEVFAPGKIAPVGLAHDNLQAGDKTTIRATGSGAVTVMFRDIESGISLCQVTFSVVGPATP